MTLGIWITPSILGKSAGAVLASDAIGLVVVSASYTVSYDDGIK